MTSELSENTQAVLDRQQIFAALRWRCRRGMRELDQVLIQFLEKLDPDDEQMMLSFKSLLEAEDSDLWHWLIGHSKPARPDWGNIIEKIRGSTHT